MIRGLQIFGTRPSTLFAGVLASVAVSAFITPAAQAAEAHRVAGKVYIQQVQLAFVGSGAAGKGRLTYKGRTYAFKVAGLGVGGVGLSKLTATGDVYDLNRLADFEGLYGQARTGWAVAQKGGGRLWLVNTKGVTLKLQTRRQGLMLAGGADGVDIRFSR